jgi:hypothetical protein
MKISLNNEVSTPQAFIAVNKSRIKQYDKSGDTPTYYLQKGQEFQLELFNPTTGTILAKIFLNWQFLIWLFFKLAPCSVLSLKFT